MSLLSIEATFGSLPRSAVRHPRLTLWLTALLLVLAIPGLERLRLRTDGKALVPRDDAAVLVDASVQETFRLREPIVVVVRSERPEGIYDTEVLATVRRLTEAFAALEGVGADQVTSLASEKRYRVVPGTLEFQTFLEPLPSTPASMSELRTDVETVGAAMGGLVSAGERATAILVGIPGLVEFDDRARLYRRVLGIVESLRTERVEIDVVGAPVAEVELGRYILADLSRLVPLSLVLIALLIWLAYRRVAGVVLALAKVGACLAWTFGLMGWSGVPVYLTTAVLPVILTTIGLADEMHVFWHYQQRLARAGSAAHPSSVVDTLQTMVRPIVLNALICSLGFLSFLLSPLEPVRAFGIFATAGIVFCAGWSLVVLPAALALVSPARMNAPAGRGLLARIPAALLPAIRRPRLTLAVLLAVSLVAGWGVRYLRVQDSWIAGFSAESPFRRAVDAFQADFGGMHRLLVRVRFAEGAPGATGALSNPQALTRIGELEEFLRTQPEVGRVSGPYLQLSRAHSLVFGSAAPSSLPADADGMRRLLAYFEMFRGTTRRRELIDDEGQQFLVTAFLGNANYRDTQRLMQATGEFFAARLAPMGARLDYAGDVAVSQAMIPAIVRTQIRSTLLAPLSILVVVSLLLRSPVAGVKATLPAALAALWMLGAMGWAGIPLGVATSMFCAITVGVGVDYAIHLLEAARRHAGPHAAARAAADVGPPIVADTLAVGLGFGVLAASRVPASALLGGFVAVTLLVGCALTLGGLGALIALENRKTL